MTIDWKKELAHFRHIFFWYMRTGLISIPFGILYACIVLRLGHESTPVLVVTLTAAIAAVFKIQGMPPRE